MLDRFRHIVVEGPIGAGKTSLASRLAQSLGAELLLEHSDGNPFLERFYRDRARYAMPTQLHFLFQIIVLWHVIRHNTSRRSLTQKPLRSDSLSLQG